MLDIIKSTNIDKKEVDRFFIIAQIKHINMLTTRKAKNL